MLDETAPVLGHIIAKAAGAAENVASSLENGLPFRCTRVGGALVTAEDCVNRALTAKADPVSVSPCLECATVMAILRKIKPKKEINEMARPRKTEPVETAVPVPAPDNPFADWSRHGKHSRLLCETERFVGLHRGGSLGFSKAAITDLRLAECRSVDLYHQDSKIGLVFHRDKAGTHTVSYNQKNGRLSVSICGLLKRMGAVATNGGRFDYTAHSPGIVEINLTQPLDGPHAQTQ